MVIATAWQKDSTSIPPSRLRNFMRLRDARLHAVSSRNIYSLHGLEELICAVFEHVCQLLIVVWNWTPGSPETHAASAISFKRSLERYVSIVRPSRTAFVAQDLSSTTVRMKLSVTPTEWFAFW